MDPAFETIINNRDLQVVSRMGPTGLSSMSMFKMAATDTLWVVSGKRPETLPELTSFPYSSTAESNFIQN